MSDLFLERDAVISDCQQYRYLLRRLWDRAKPLLLFVMLNPSTADAFIDDATIRSCIRLAKLFGYGGFEVVNLFAFRATDPAHLSAPRDPIGPDNDSHIECAAGRCERIVCAWGAHKMAESRARAVLRVLSPRRPIFCLGTTKTGAPKHPLYIKSGTPMDAYWS